MKTLSTLYIAIPGVRLVSSMNVREHWAQKARRAKRERQLAHYSMLSARHAKPAPPCVVTLTRMYSGRSKEMDRDNLIASMKNLRDGIADWIGVDDAERHGIRWEYEQARGVTCSLVVSIASG